MNDGNSIKSTLHHLMIDGIQYEKIGNSFYEMRLFEQNEFETWFEENKDFKVTNSEKTIYDNFIPLDSGVEISLHRIAKAAKMWSFILSFPSGLKLTLQ